MKGDSLSENSVDGEDRKILDYHEINEREKNRWKNSSTFLISLQFFNHIEVFFVKMYARGKFC